VQAVAVKEEVRTQTGAFLTKPVVSKEVQVKLLSLEPGFVPWSITKRLASIFISRLQLGQR